MLFAVTLPGLGRGTAPLSDPGCVSTLGSRVSGAILMALNEVVIPALPGAVEICTLASLSEAKFSSGGLCAMPVVTAKETTLSELVVAGAILAAAGTAGEASGTLSMDRANLFAARAGQKGSPGPLPRAPEPPTSLAQRENGPRPNHVPLETTVPGGDVEGRREAAGGGGVLAECG